MGFKHLVRFLGKDSKIHVGDAVLSAEVSDPRFATHARLIKGDIFGEYSVTDKVVAIEQLLCPLDLDQLKTVRLLGLNYTKHAIETNMPIPKYPVLFYKPLTAISGPESPIVVPKIAQTTAADGEKNPEIASVDYECELVIIIGKECRDVSPEEALHYVLGYCAGNDMSHRLWQIARGGSQFSLGKMYDGWAPIGPAIASPEVVSDPNGLQIRTYVNEEVLQDGTTSDQVFNVAQTISFLSQGSTLLPGDVIFTGTPSGVGMGRDPRRWLVDGDVVRIEIEKVGTIENKVVFEKDRKSICQKAKM